MRNESSKNPTAAPASPNYTYMYIYIYIHLYLQLPCKHLATRAGTCPILYGVACLRCNTRLAETSSVVPLCWVKRGKERYTYLRMLWAHASLCTVSYTHLGCHRRVFKHLRPGQHSVPRVGEASQVGICYVCVGRAPARRGRRGRAEVTAGHVVHVVQFVDYHKFALQPEKKRIRAMHMGET